MSLVKNMHYSIQQLSKSEKHLKERQRLEKVLREVIRNAIEHFNGNGWSCSDLIEVFNIIKDLSDVKWEEIEYRKTWFEYADSAIEILEGDYAEWHEYYDFMGFVTLTRIVVGYAPRFLADDNVKQKWEDVIETFERRGEEESLTDVCDPDAKLAEELYESYDNSKRMFERLATMVESEDRNAKFMKISNNFDISMEDVSTYISPEPDYDRDDNLYYDSSDDYSLEQIFRDL